MDYLGRVGSGLRAVPDPIGELSTRYLVNSMPTHYFIGSDGNIAAIRKGALSQVEIEQQLVELGLGR